MFEIVKEVAKSLGAKYVEVNPLFIEEASDVSECRWEGPCLADKCERFTDLESRLYTALSDASSVYVFTCEVGDDVYLLMIVCVGRFCLAVTVDDVFDPLMLANTMVRTIENEYERINIELQRALIQG